MILSTNRELGEFEACREPKHIARVWGAIEERLPRYWDRFVMREGAKAAGSRISSKAAMQAFATAIQQYEKQATKYRDFFDSEAMDEFSEDPGVFKQHMAKEVPIISSTLKQRRTELQEWQRNFRGCRSRDLYEVFANILDFHKDWTKGQLETVYANYDSPGNIGLDPLDNDEKMGLVSVIGMGIKSIVLYHLDPRLLPQRGRNDLYGLYFLSGMDDFGLASKSSEFIMINDREVASNGSMIMEHNFWYSYGLFTLYALRIFRWMQARVSADGVILDTSVRYVYVAHFLSQICSEHVEDMKIMRAHDRFEV